mgnify:CR=1 FL=1
MATITNQAALSYNGVTTLSNIAVGELVEVLTATKTAADTTYTAGGVKTFVISLVNSSAAALTGLTVTDTLYPLTYVTGSLLYYVNGALQATPTVTATAPLTVTGVTVPAGGSAMLIYTARVNEYAPLGVEDSITNTATITGGGLTSSVTATETINASPAPQLAISKSISPTMVAENGTLTYTLTLQNRGNTAADAGDELVITDTFDPILKNLTARFNGTLWTQGVHYTYDETTGTFATVVGALTVPAATFTQDAATGVFTVDPGTSELTITGSL